jgi:hypothetical protein
MNYLRSKSMKSTPEQLLEIRPAWEAFRKLYPGKTAKTPDWNNFVARQTKPKALVGSYYGAHEIIPLLIPAVEYQKKARDWEQKQGIFVPSWKNLQTWITNMCWEEEHPEYDMAMETLSEEDNEIGTHAVKESEAAKFW